MSKQPTGRAVTLAVVAFLCGIGTANWLPAATGAGEGSPYQLAAAAPSVVTPVVQTSLPQQRPAAGTDEARRFSRAFADAAEGVTPAVVRIQTERPLPDGQRNLQNRMRDLFDRLPEGHPDPYPDVAGGTGVLVSGDGLILTNNHVIAGASRITVTLADKRVYEATVVGADPTTDIALIVVDEGGLPTARLGDSDAVRVGEWVLAIGNPAFHRASTLDFTVTSGIVSAKGRPLDVIRQELLQGREQTRAVAAYAIEDFIQTDAAINPGNSGGPLVDLDGAIIGINTAIASGSGFNQGYGFAVPINMAKRVMADLLEYGHVRRPLLGIGIQNVEPEDAQVYGLPRIAGVLIEDFPDGSPAEQAGLRRHDVIVAVDGEPVERVGQFQRMIASHRPGDLVEVDVVRFGEQRRYAVRLMEADLGNQRVVRTAPERPRNPDLGLEFVDLTSSMARERRYSGAGALIAAVRPNSPANRRGIDRGLLVREINREKVESAAAAERILRSLPSGAIASLLLEDEQGATSIRNLRVP